MSAKIIPVRQGAASTLTAEEIDKITTKAIHQSRTASYIEDTKSIGQCAFYYTWLIVKRIVCSQKRQTLKGAIEGALPQIIIFLEDNPPKKGLPPPTIESLKAYLIECIRNIRSEELRGMAEISALLFDRHRKAIQNYRFLRPTSPCCLFGLVTPFCAPPDTAPDVEVLTLTPHQEELFRQGQRNLIREILKLLYSFRAQIVDPTQRGIRVVSIEEMTKQSNFDLFFSPEKRDAMRASLLAAMGEVCTEFFENTLLTDHMLKKITITIHCFVKRVHFQRVKCPSPVECALRAFDTFVQDTTTPATERDDFREKFMTPPYYFPNSTLGHFQTWNYVIRFSKLLYEYYDKYHLYSRKTGPRSWICLGDEGCFTQGRPSPVERDEEGRVFTRYNFLATSATAQYRRQFYVEFYLPTTKQDVLTLCQTVPEQGITNMERELRKQGLFPF